MASACSEVIVRMRAISRLTSCTSSSLNCLIISALALSPINTRSTAALRAPLRISGFWALVIMLYGTVVGQPGPEDVGRPRRVLGHAVAQVLDQNLRLLSGDGGQLQTAERSLVGLR